MNTSADEETSPATPEHAEAGTTVSRDASDRATHRRRALVGAGLVVILLAGLATAWTLRDPKANDPVSADVVFSFGQTSVTKGKMADRLKVLKVLYGLQAPLEAAELEDFRRKTARTFAATLLIGASAQAKGIAADPATVQLTLRRFVQQRYGPNGDPDFRQYLSDVGVSVGAVTEEIALQLNGQALFDRVTREVTTTPAEVRAAYNADPAVWATPSRRRLRMIVTADRSTASQVLAEQSSGADFGELATRFSLDGTTSDRGGDLGFLSREELDPAFGAAAFRTDVGDVFGPVETARGWYVGQVVQVVPPATSFLSLRRQVREALIVERSLSVWRTEVAELLARAEITYGAGYEPTPGSESDLVAPGGQP